jgi:recombination protein RecR
MILFLKMFPSNLEKLIELFTRFPGIGPRQATRFVFSLLKEDESILEELGNSIKNLKKEVTACQVCFRSMAKAEGNVCSICSDKKRDASAVMVVEKESDMVNMEKTGSFRGLYHILGGVILPLDPNSSRGLHIKELFERVKAKAVNEGGVEVILATNPTTEGDTTALYIERVLEPLKSSYKNLKISRLGRGLSLGSELEYADESTLKNAFLNRK